MRREEDHCRDFQSLSFRAGHFLVLRLAGSIICLTTKFFLIMP